MLGPSGSGKTTCLRLIAGFEQLSGGAIAIYGHKASELPPWQRDVNTVFQDYALFPHMSILDNVAYGLMVKGIGKKGAISRAGGAGKGGSGFVHTANRRSSPAASGSGWRLPALVNEPRVLLLDEPLGALDLKLREQMQVELKKLQQTLGITFIFVTHDQGEALSMSDRVAVFNNGRIEQVMPRTTSICVQNRVCCRFVGTANVFDSELAARLCGMRGVWSLRPEHIRLTAAEKCRFRAWCRRCSTRGGDAYRTEAGEWRQAAGQPGEQRWRDGIQRAADRTNGAGFVVTFGDGAFGTARAEMTMVIPRAVRASVRTLLAQAIAGPVLAAAGPADVVWHRLSGIVADPAVAKRLHL
jgi:ABC-type Fe3+/spermidine/putrescine transport system ATPase subunit